MKAGNDTESAGRLFIGVPLAEEARGGIEAWLRRALPEGVPGRAVPATNWHLTLRFLGASTTEQFALVREHLREAALGPAFTAGFGELGAFSRPRRARVMWIGIAEGAERLRELAAVAENAARAAGFAPEEKRFTPHLTISRIHPPRDVTRAIAAAPTLELAMPVGELVVFRSHLGGGPARYEAVERLPLG
jgi:2'-5' RNA ligase